MSSYYEKFADGKVKCIDEEIPFEIPSGWEWVRLRELATVFGRIGFRGYTKADMVEKGSGAISISPSNMMADGSMSFHNNTYISWEKYRESPEIMIQSGDILVVKTGSSYGKTCKVESLPEKSTINPQIAVLKFVLCDSDWLATCLSSPIAFSQFQKYVLGTSIPTFSQERLSSTLLPLPPDREQKQILKRINLVNPLVTNYDFLDKRLEELNNRLYTDIKKSILIEAIKGNLVEQYLSDEPVSVLLDRIRIEKERLGKSGQIKKKDVLDSVIFKDDDNKYYEKIKGKVLDISEEIPFDIPASWEWCRLGTLMSVISDGTHKTPSYVENGIPFLSVQNISSGQLDTQKIKYITEQEHRQLCVRVAPQKNDILFCRIGTLGKALKVYWDFEFSIFVSLGLLRPVINEISEYIVLYLNSPIGFHWIQENKVGGGTHTFKINLTDLPNMLVCLPPLNEQKRIVDHLTVIASTMRKLAI